MLKHRIYTALVLIPLVILAIFYLPPLLFSFILAIILGMGIWEWTRLINLLHLKERYIYLIVMEVILFAFLLMPTQIFNSLVLPILWLSILGWLFALLFVIDSEKFSKLWTSQIFRIAAGGFLFIPCWLALNFLKQNPNTLFFLFILLLLTWAADIGAYFSGRRFGKHKLAPKISPGKTIEGVFGGLIIVVLLALVIGFSLKLTLLKWFIWMLITLVLGCISVLGDLFESLIKRQSGVKDSGHLLPGHGGILDRIDSLLATAPVFTLGIIILWNN